MNNNNDKNGIIFIINIFFSVLEDSHAWCQLNLMLKFLNGKNTVENATFRLGSALS